MYHSYGVKMASSLPARVICVAQGRDKTSMLAALSAISLTSLLFHLFCYCLVSLADMAGAARFRHCH